MKRDINGLQTALRKRGARMLIDTTTGVILGYCDVKGKTGEVRGDVCTAIANKGVVILTVDEYLRMTMSDDEKQRRMSKIVTAGDWYRELDKDGRLDKILQNNNQFIHYN